jgi:hypothetical protein
MPHLEDQPIPESTYPVLARPEFKSQIPAPLLENASETDRYIMEQLSKLGQFAAWSVDAQLSTNEQVRHTNGRVKRAESNIAHIQQDEQKVVWSWKAVAKIGGALMGLATFIYFIVGIASCSPAK